MGQKISTTELLNEYMVAFNDTVLLINNKLPKVESAIDKQIAFFGPFSNATVDSVKSEYVYLDIQRPIPFTRNVYKYSENRANNTNMRSNGSAGVPDEEEKYKMLLDWGRAMLTIFQNMRKNITHYSRAINEIYKSINQNTYPIVKMILRDYSNYIWKCYDFASSVQVDMLNYPERLQTWNTKQLNLLNSLDQNIAVVTQFTPQPTLIRADLPPVIDDKTTLSPPSESVPVFPAGQVAMNANSEGTPQKQYATNKNYSGSGYREYELAGDSNIFNSQRHAEYIDHYPILHRGGHRHPYKSYIGSTGNTTEIRSHPRRRRKDMKHVEKILLTDLPFFQ